jgi:hypothetical protein
VLYDLDSVHCVDFLSPFSQEFWAWPPYRNVHL